MAKSADQETRGQHPRDREAVWTEHYRDVYTAWTARFPQDVKGFQLRTVGTIYVPQFVALADPDYPWEYLHNIMIGSNSQEAHELTRGEIRKILEALRRVD